MMGWIIQRKAMSLDGYEQMKNKENKKKKIVAIRVIAKRLTYLGLFTDHF